MGKVTENCSAGLSLSFGYLLIPVQLKVSHSHVDSFLLHLSLFSRNSGCPHTRPLLPWPALQGLLPTIHMHCVYCCRLRVGWQWNYGLCVAWVVLQGKGLKIAPKRAYCLTRFKQETQRWRPGTAIVSGQPGFPNMSRIVIALQTHSYLIAISIAISGLLLKHHNAVSYFAHFARACCLLLLATAAGCCLLSKSDLSTSNWKEGYNIWMAITISLTLTYHVCAVCWCQWPQIPPSRLPRAPSLLAWLP